MLCPANANYAASNELCSIKRSSEFADFLFFADIYIDQRVRWAYDRTMHQIKRNAERERPLKTAQVARILGVKTRSLQHWLATGRYPEPPRDPESGYRIWHHQDVEAVRLAMQGESQASHEQIL